MNEASPYQLEGDQQPQRCEQHGRNQSLVSTLRTVLRQSWKLRAVALASLVGYWLLYAVSSGMIFYYAADLTPILQTSPVRNPYFYLNFREFIDFYNSGMIWFPNGHLQLNLLFGPTTFSIILSALFALNMVLSSYSLSSERLGKKHGMGGFLGMVPALFTGGCCSIPIGILLIGAIVPSTALTALSTFIFTYAFLTNVLVGSLMLISLTYNYRKVARASCVVGSLAGDEFPI